jgi:hypothetical protein
MAGREIIETVIGRRLETIRERAPELEAAYEIVNNDWGFIMIQENGTNWGCEFVESDSSWTFHTRMSLYARLLREGLYVGVIVPDRVYMIMMAKIAGLGVRHPCLMCYDEKGQIHPPRPG